MKRNANIISIMVVILLCGCSSLKVENNLETLLENRANALMQARVNGNWEAVYHFFIENYKKETSIKPFKQTKQLNVLSYTIDNIEILPSATEAKVTVKSIIIINNLRQLTISEDQKWVYENQNWYLFNKPSKGLFG